MRKLTIPAADGGAFPLCRIALGTTYLGSSLDEAASFALLDRYHELGGRTLDTARVYGVADAGAPCAEPLLGRWLHRRGLRGDVTLITKGAFPHPDGRSRLSPDCIRSDLEASLEALGVPQVELFFLHRDDPALPVGPIMETLHALVAEGKARALGASNWRAARIREANDYAQAHGLTPFAVSQIQWSLASGSNEAIGDDTIVIMDEQEYRQYREMQLPVMAFTAQAKGLYQKYLAHGAEGLTPKSRRFFTPENIARAKALRAIAAARGVSPTAVVLGYLTSNPLQAGAVIGCLKLEQLEDCMAAQDFVLDARELAELGGVGSAAL